MFWVKKFGLEHFGLNFEFWLIKNGLQARQARQKPWKVLNILDEYYIKDFWGAAYKAGNLVPCKAGNLVAYKARKLVAYKAGQLVAY